MSIVIQLVTKEHTEEKQSIIFMTLKIQTLKAIKKKTRHSQFPVNKTEDRREETQPVSISNCANAIPCSSLSETVLKSD